MPLYRWELDAQADNETDAAIVAEVLVGAFRDERNDSTEPVRIGFRSLEGDDVLTPEDVEDANA